MEILFFRTIPNSLISLLLILLFGIPIAIIDFKSQRIPLYLSISGIVIAILVQLILKVHPLVLAAEISIGFISFYLIRVLTRKGLGLGDALISAFIAVLVGLWGWILSIFLAALGALIFGLIFLKYNIRDRSRRIPFAPFLMGGSLVTILYYYFFT